MSQQITQSLFSKNLATELNADSFKATATLMEYVNFLGCSPSLSSGNLEAFICLHAGANPFWIGGDGITAVKLSCGHTTTSNPGLFDTEELHCPSCSEISSREKINWRKTAGYATFFIEITNIFPKEAQPSEALFSLLQSLSDSNWQHFYALSRCV